MSINLVRIDDRLIHGQVVTTWVNNYKIEQILIINDKLVSDKIQKSVLTMTAPSGVTVLVFGVEQFIEILKTNTIKKSTMLLLTTCTDVLRLVEGGLKLEKLNVGGMRLQEGRKKFTKSVSATDEEEKAFKELVALGVNVEIQMVPNDPIINISEVIK